jgi:hypothetical protein
MLLNTIADIECDDKFRQIMLVHAVQRSHAASRRLTSNKLADI